MATIRLAILSLLSDQQLHSGKAIASKLACSRSAIWYQIQKLKKMGFNIRSSSRLGYQLCDFFDPVDIHHIEHTLGQHKPPYHLKLLEQTGSTNTDLRETARQGEHHKSVLISEKQTKGRGRRGRKWHATFGKSLLFSVLWRFEKPMDNLASLTLAVGVSLIRTFTKLGIDHLKLKWPNDLVEAAQYGKIAGTLIEIQGNMSTACAAIIGIGINVYEQQPEAKMDYPCVALATLTKDLPGRNDILTQLLMDLDHTLGLYEEHQLVPFVDEFNRHCAWLNQPVTAILPSGQNIKGLCKGIDKNGALLIFLPETNTLYPLTSGDISLRQ